MPVLIRSDELSEICESARCDERAMQEIRVGKGVPMQRALREIAHDLEILAIDGFESVEPLDADESNNYKPTSMSG